MAAELHNLVVNEGAREKHFRRGQGLGSGNGKTAGKGQKGQGAHAHTKKHGFEGGQMPLARRLPKFGFKNVSKKNFAIVNLGDLNGFKAGEKVDATTLISSGLVKNALDGIKILGKGTLTVKLDVEASAFSASAKKAIEEKGGTAKVVK
ncbi:MAG: 50S ribosomal protein L15 [Bacilli bacterium]|jgi:large subunit ribosomal protein L15|nr:50S ribosomal protein L15 [Bacilli bacterium]